MKGMYHSKKNAKGAGICLGWLLFLSLAFSSCTLGKMIRHGVSGVEDHRIFPYRELKPSPKPRPIPEDPASGRMPESLVFEGKTLELDRFFRENQTLAFIAIRNGKRISERYYNGHAPDAVSMSFSMAKSFTSLLIGCAIRDGYIRSENQRVTDFLPELAPNGFDQVRIRHLLQMTAGSDYLEADHPLAVHPYLYYTDDMKYILKRMAVVDKPGTRWRYKSGENELLGWILQRALPRGVTVTDYMQRKLWDPLGMEDGARFCVDRLPNGLEKTFCCLAATARDFAKIGLMVLQNGTWNGQQAVPADWIRKSTMLDEREGSPWGYQYQWWKLSPDGHDLMAGGWLGQYIYVDYKRNLVLVRLGTGFGSFSMKQWRAFWVALAARIGEVVSDGATAGPDSALRPGRPPDTGKASTTPP